MKVKQHGLVVEEVIAAFFLNQIINLMQIFLILSMQEVSQMWLLMRTQIQGYLYIKMAGILLEEPV